MDSVLKENFIEATKAAQKSIVTGCILAILLYVFAKKGEIGDFAIPILGFTTSGETGLFLVFILYFVTGLSLLFYIVRATKNYKKIGSSELQKALQLYPSFACGSLYTRLTACVTPIGSFGVAMYTAYPDNIGVAYFMVFIFSIPYFAAGFVSVESNA